MKSIYGLTDPCPQPNLQLLLDLITPSFADEVESIYRFVDKLIKVTLTGLIVGNMPVTAILPLAVIVRLEWVRQNPRTMFSATNPDHLFEIKDLYLRFRGDWRTDELFGGVVPP